MRRVLALAVLGGLALVPARPAAASAFRVTPIRVDFNAKSSSVLMTLVNESAEELRFQVSAYEWSQQTGSGEMQLKPTDEIIFFPQLLTLKAGEERKIRVGKTMPAGPVEKTFRIFFEELPPLTTPETKGAEVRIITKIGVPIFVEPAAPKAVPSVSAPVTRSGKLAFDVTNNGNTHFFVRVVRVIGIDAAGKAAFTKSREGWYLLSGDSRRYELELTPAECSAIARVRVEVDTDLTRPGESLVKSDGAVAPGACGP